MALQSDVFNASSSLAANISAGVVLVNGNTNTTVGNASSSLASAITTDTTTVNANTNSQVASAITSVNTNTNTIVAAASSSLGANISSLPSTIWNYSGRTLSSFGTLVTDMTSSVWNAANRTLTSLTLSSQTPWVVNTSDFGSVVAGSNYLSTVTTVYNGTLTDSLNLPTVNVYDPSGNLVVNGAAMTRIATGTYTYSYATAGNAQAGTWESVFSANVATGNILPGVDYWTVVTNPAQVKINSITNKVTPSITANVTITDEGLTGNEYQYEWCVVSSPNEQCGAKTNIFDEVAAKYINQGQDFNTNLTANVPNPGTYYFKLVAYFGTESSVSYQTFTAVAPTSNGGGGGSGGTGGGTSGGGGGCGGGGSSGGAGGGAPSASPPVTGVRVCGKLGDFNCDGKVNTVDFAILLYFWGTKPPFANPYVDMSHNGKIDAKTFSIFLYYWGK